MTRSVDTRRAVLAVLSMLIGPAGVVWLLRHERYGPALILLGLLAAHALAEAAVFHRRDRSARVRLRTVERDQAGPLLDRVVGW